MTTTDKQAARAARLRNLTEQSPYLASLKPILPAYVYAQCVERAVAQGEISVRDYLNDRRGVQIAD